MEIRLTNFSTLKLDRRSLAPFGERLCAVSSLPDRNPPTPDLVVHSLIAAPMLRASITANALA